MVVIEYAQIVVARFAGHRSFAPLRGEADFVCSCFRNEQARSLRGLTPSLTAYDCTAPREKR